MVANDAKMVDKNDANLALPPKFRQVLIESPINTLFLAHHTYATGWTTQQLEKIRSSPYPGKLRICQMCSLKQLLMSAPLQSPVPYSAVGRQLKMPGVFRAGEKYLYL
ncbi:hypothetical protein TNCV_622271 [Trichonephila clavipes]|nr:hypothetical protein TNCV_622271 [Trichonephila clavipes]